MGGEIGCGGGFGQTGVGGEEGCGGFGPGIGDGGVERGGYGEGGVMG